MFSYEWDNGEVLSARCDENTCSARERSDHTLLRPVFINAVEVGYAYSQCDKDRRLNVRGVTIALWYFISRGHQTLALLPYCFKSYADKSSSWTELMALFKMNLVEFTPGFGSDKYVEVNRILATRADEVGGCIVARSQMHNIVEERPALHRVVERRLLMPSFNGIDIIFPVDGPLGRNGPTLQETLECPMTDTDWGRCSHHQLSLQDQRIWMQRLTVVMPELLSWTALSKIVSSFQPTTPLPDVPLPPRPDQLSHAKIHPPETNPVEGKGYSYTRAAIRRANPESFPVSTTYPAYTPYGNTPMMTYRDALGLGTPNYGLDYENCERTDPFLPEYMRTGAEHSATEPRFEETAAPLPNFLGHEGSIYRLRSTVDAMTTTDDLVQKDEEEKKELIGKLALIFGWQRAVCVVGKNPLVRSLSLLVEYALNDSEGDMSTQDVASNIDNTNEMPSGQVAEESLPPGPPVADLIDFSSAPEPIPVAAPVAAASSDASKSPPVAQTTSLLD